MHLSLTERKNQVQDSFTVSVYILSINTYAFYFWLCGCFLTLCRWSVMMIAMFYIQRVIITLQLHCHAVCLPEKEDEVGRGVYSLHLYGLQNLHGSAKILRSVGEASLLQKHTNYSK